MQTPLAEPDEEQKQVPGHHPPLIAERRSMPPAPGAVLEFRRFRILLRRRELLADGVPVKLGTRAFDLLMVLVEAEGSLVTKAELLGRVWPGIVVIEDNLKVQISKLREALAGDGDLIRTEFGRGYRFTGEARRLTIEVAEAWPVAGGDLDGIRDGTGRTGGSRGNRLAVDVSRNEIGRGDAEAECCTAPRCL